MNMNRPDGLCKQRRDDAIPESSSNVFIHMWGFTGETWHYNSDFTSCKSHGPSPRWTRINEAASAGFWPSDQNFSLWRFFWTRPTGTRLRTDPEHTGRIKDPIWTGSASGLPGGTRRRLGYFPKPAANGTWTNAAASIHTRSSPDGGAASSVCLVDIWMDEDILDFGSDGPGWISTWIINRMWLCLLLLNAVSWAAPLPADWIITSPPGCVIGFTVQLINHDIKSTGTSSVSVMYSIQSWMLMPDEATVSHDEVNMGTGASTRYLPARAGSIRGIGS